MGIIIVKETPKQKEEDTRSEARKSFDTAHNFVAAMVNNLASDNPINLETTTTQLGVAVQSYNDLTVEEKLDFIHDLSRVLKDAAEYNIKTTIKPRLPAAVAQQIALVR